jgi:hypothetical protein
MARERKVIYGSFRTRLAILWAVCFATAMVLTLYLRWIVKIGPEPWGKLFELVVSQYAPFFGSVLAFHFASSTVLSRRNEAQRTPYFLAMTTSALWNVVMLGFIIQPCVNYDRTGQAIADIQTILPWLSWIVSPAIGFFFGRPPGAEA